MTAPLASRGLLVTEGWAGAEDLWEEAKETGRLKTPTGRRGRVGAPSLMGSLQLPPSRGLQW